MARSRLALRLMLSAALGLTLASSASTASALNSSLATSCVSVDSAEVPGDYHRILGRVMWNANGQGDVLVHNSGEPAPDGAGIPYPLPESSTSAVKPAIVLVGGVNEDYGFDSPDNNNHPWHDVYAYLKHAHGYDVYVVPSQKNAAWPGVVDSLGGYAGDNAEQIQRYLQGQGLQNRDVIIIGHSMGGLIARKWAGSPWLWRSNALSPRAIIQLGTPNAGSPITVIEQMWGRNTNKSNYELDDHASTIANFNSAFQNEGGGIPILRLGGEFFPWSAGLSALTPLSPVEAFAAESLRWNFGFSTPNDGVVSAPSLLAGPTSGNGGSDFYPVMQSRGGLLGAFDTASTGFILPRHDTAVENQILARILRFCEDTRLGNIRATPLAGAQSSATGHASSGAPVRSVAPAALPEGGSSFATVVDNQYNLSAGVTSTIDFSVEGTWALAQIACADPGLKIDIKGASGAVFSEKRATSDGVLLAFPTNARGASLELRSALTTSATVSILDSGWTVLVVDTQASGVSGSDVLVAARLKRDSSNLPGSFVARVDDGFSTAMSDDGSGADATASDGVYSASVHLPDSGMAARVTVDASAAGGVQRTGFHLTEVVEPRATISDTPALSTGLTASGKIGQVLVDVPVNASTDCTVQVAANLGSASGMIAQSMPQQAFAAGSSSVVRVTFDAEDLNALSDDATALVASIKLYDSTDGGLSLLDAATSDSLSIAKTDLALAACTIDPFGKPVNMDPVIITGSASCTSETISGIDISLDGGNEWLVAPEPAGGWGSKETTWSCAFTLPEGEYGASVRLRGASGLIAGATDSLVFSVDRTAPSGMMNIANGAPFAAPSFTIDSAVVGAVEMRMRASLNGATWGSWSGWSSYDASIDVGVARTSQMWWYQLEYRDEAGNVLALTDDVMVDATAPSTKSNGKSVYDLSAAIKLTASDGPMAGVAKTEWRLDGGAWMNGTVASTSKAGDRVLQFRSNDKVGNVETTRVLKFRVRPRASLGTPRAPSKMSQSRSYTVYGYLKPRHTSGSYPVRIYRWSKVTMLSGIVVWIPHGYVKAKASNYSSNGQSYTKYSAKISVPKSSHPLPQSTWRLRAYAPADSWHAATWSSGSDYVTVK
ncbi:MAG: hypothetical protein CVT67_02765 [Actinobacteria bacterium HGW-Actinobacteria-7]|nr:MAG: hypothetical protein CVT67_02765 [Actinobacteria bacterium HGW-Actinobacteria-7]